MAAVWKRVGTIPEVSKEGIMAEKKGRRDGRQDLTRAVGRGSRRHVEGLDFWMSSVISEGDGR